MDLGIAQSKSEYSKTQVLFSPHFFALEVYYVAPKSPTLASNYKIWGSANWYNSRNYGRLDLSSIEYKVKNLS